MVSEHEGLIRLACFAAVLVLMAVWELAAPRRTLLVRKGRRWGGNLVLVVVNTLAVRLLLPLTAVALADRAADRGWGALNLVDWPAPLEFALGFIALDFAIYLQHVMFHAVPVFWRLHRVHHADLDFDVTTGLRFHTIEILLSMLTARRDPDVGPLRGAWSCSEIVLNATSMFNHSNVRMPAPIDHVLRWLVVTPDMHRVHHSVVRRETDSNVGFNLPWWDRLCGTYRAQPEAGHEGMTIGLEELRDERQTTPLHRILWMPFGRNDRATGTFAADDQPDANPQSPLRAAGPFPNAGNAVSAVENSGCPPYHPPQTTAERTPSSPPVAVANDNAQGHVRQREEVDRGA